MKKLRFKRRAASYALVFTAICFMSYGFQNPDSSQETSGWASVQQAEYGKPVPKQQLLAQKRIRASLGEDFAFDVKFTVVSYSFVFAPKVGESKVLPATNDKITKSMKDLIRKSRKGDMIIIDRIRAKGPNGVVALAPVLYRII